MKFHCQRCGRLVGNPVWLMDHGRLVRVGADCAVAIRREAEANTDRRRQAQLRDK